jgi:predicted O-methyltransferase YrrM
MLKTLALPVVAVSSALAVALAQAPPPTDGLDRKVRQLLDDRRGTWRDMNVPTADGQALYDVIVERGAKRAVEIGTSTGHSGIWIAWALSKTGGRLITIEVDPERHREAVATFRQAGLDALIDARLADAHELVPRLEGPIDFVFIDADKDWYTNYAKALVPKLSARACLTAHNVSPRRGWRQMTGDYHDYVTGLADFETTFRAGVMVSCKRGR